jgi:hypothetical protein
MPAAADYQALETLLLDLQLQIQARGVFATLLDLQVNTAHRRPLLARLDVAPIERYAQQFHSSLRQVALLSLQLADELPHLPACLPLIIASLQAGLHRDVLQLVDQMAPADPAAAPLAIQAAYRLGLWPELLLYASVLPDEVMPIALQLMVARAQLQEGLPCAALAHLAKLQPHSGSEQRQLQLLQLLARHRCGLFTQADLRRFLALFPNASAAERAALAALWPAAEALLTRAELSSPTLHLALRHFWQGLCQVTMLVDGSEVVPALRSGSSIERLALVIADGSQLPLYEQLLQALSARSKGDLNVQLLVLHPGATDLAASVSRLDLHGLSVSGMVHQLRRLELDAVIDTVGLHDARWLEVLAQRVAALQIGWLAPDLATVQAPLYDALVVDRWTQPAESLQFQVRLLQVSGLAVLTHPAALPSRRSSAPAAADGTLQVLVLGSPEQLLPGSAVLLRQILAQAPALTIAFLDPAWSEPGLLEAWWSAEQPQPLPAQLQLMAGLEAITSADPSFCVGLSLNQCSPTVSALQLISLGIPIVCLASQLQGIQPLCGLLEALGLQAFVTADPQHCLAILAEWAADPELRSHLGEALPTQLANSLAMDLDLFASDLLQGLHLLKHAA